MSREQCVSGLLILNLRHNNIMHQEDIILHGSSHNPQIGGLSARRGARRITAPSLRGGVRCIGAVKLTVVTHVPVDPTSLRHDRVADRHACWDGCAHVDAHVLGEGHAVQTGALPREHLHPGTGQAIDFVVGIAEGVAGGESGQIRFQGQCTAVLDLHRQGVLCVGTAAVKR